MAMTQCKECKQEVSSEAKTCPHCGVKKPAVNASDAIKGFFSLVFIIWVVWLFIGDDEDTAAVAEPEISPEECKKELACWGEKYSVDAQVDCHPRIERMAKYDVEWTDGFLEQKFSRYKWKDQAQGHITYFGDKAKFQNGFGAFQNIIYACDYDTMNKEVLDVQVAEGRL